MSAKHVLFAALSISILLSTFASASTTSRTTDRSAPVTVSSMKAHKVAEGPIPVPLCEPKVETCPSLPPYPTSLKQNLNIAEGPIPVPLCEPKVETCPSLPPYPGQVRPSLLTAAL